MKLADSGKKSWASCVQTNLQSLDIGDHSTSVKDALRTLWEALADREWKDTIWKEDAESGGK